MEYEIEFELTTPLEVEESRGNKVLLKGVFLKLNRETANGRIYSIEEGEQIASDLTGMPAYFGSNWLGKHLVSEDHIIGKIVSAVFDKVKGVIEGTIEVWNNSKFPNLLSRIRKGWGLSIKGKASAFELLPGFARNGLQRMRIRGMRAKSISLLEPHVKRGQGEAQVEEVGVEESMLFSPDLWGMCSTTPIESKTVVYIL